MRILMILLTLFPSILLAQRGVEPFLDKESIVRETYALVIGISQYEKFRSLNFADADAKVFANYLKDPSGLGLPAANVRLLLNDQAKNGDILENGMVWLEQSCKKGSRAIIYFAGHGVSVGNNSAYLMAYNVSPQFNKANIFYSGGVPLFNIKRDFIAPMHEKGIEVILIIDACRSFDAVEGKEGLTMLTQSTLDDNTGEIRILSSSNGQQSFEDMPGNMLWYGHGVFTYFLLEGLYGKADNINKDGIITFNEIKRYLQQKIPENTGFKQDPAFCCDQNMQATIGVFNKAFDESDFIKQIATDKQQLLASSSKERGGIKVVLVPEEIKPLVDSFYVNIEKKLFFGNYEADYFFTKIMDLDSLFKTVKEEVLLNYCGTLSNEVQSTIGEYLEGDMKSARSTTEISAQDILVANKKRVETKTKMLEWEDIFGLKSRSAQKLYELRLKYFPENPYNKVAEMKYYFCKSRSLRYQNKDSALIYINKALKLDSSQAYLYHVASLLSNDDLAFEYNTKCLLLLPNFIYALNVRGLLLKKMKKYQEAESILLMALSIDSKNTDCLNNLGNLYFEQKLYSKAEKMYQNCISIDSKCKWAFIKLGLIYENTNQNQKAESMYLTAMQIDPNYLAVFDRLGRLYQRQKRYRDAENMYFQALQIDTNFQSAYNALGILYSYQNRFVESENSYKSAIRIDSTYTESFFNLGLLYKKQNLYSEAEKMFLAVLSLDSTDTDACKQLVSIYNKIENTKDAEKMYLKVLSLEATDAAACEQLGSIFDKMGNAKDAEKMYLKAVGINPLCKVAYNNLGILYISQVRYDEAEAVLGKAIAIDSTFWYSQVWLGDVYRLQNKINKALVQYQKGIRIDPTFPFPYSASGKIYIARKEYQLAWHCYKKLLKIDSLNAEGISGLISCAVYLKDTVNAKALFMKELKRNILKYNNYDAIGLACRGMKYISLAEKAFLKSNQMEPEQSNSAAFLCMMYIRENYPSENYQPWIDAIKHMDKDTNTDYNLACVYSLLQKEPEFVTYFEKALVSGYKDWNHIAQDVDLDNFRESEKFKELIKKYKN